MHDAILLSSSSAFFFRITEGYPTMTEDMKPFSKYASRSQQGISRKAATRAFKRPDRAQGFARIPEGQIPAFAKVWGASLGLGLILLQRSNLRGVRQNDGWDVLPRVVLQHMGLENRDVRRRVVRRLVSQGVLEIRQPSPGTALEYRLRPVTQWPVSANRPQLVVSRWGTSSPSVARENKRIEAGTATKQSLQSVDLRNDLNGQETSNPDTAASARWTPAFCGLAQR